MLPLYLSLIECEEDKRTFEQIFNDYKEDMMAIAYHILQDRWDAEDAVQDAMLSLAVSIKRVPTQHNEMRAYSLTAAKNAALRLQKKQAKYKSTICLEDVLPVLPCDEDTFEQITRQESYVFLRNLIDQIPSHLKECLLLRYVADLPPREIAKILNRKPETVQKQLTRGKIALAKLYKGAT